jgi:hypothetical protein
MSSGVTGNRRIPNSNRPSPVVARHKHAAAEGACTRRVSSDCVATKDDIRSGAAILVNSAAVAA